MVVFLGQFNGKMCPFSKFGRLNSFVVVADWAPLYHAPLCVLPDICIMIRAYYNFFNVCICPSDFCDKKLLHIVIGNPVL